MKQLKDDQKQKMINISNGLRTKSAKIRALAAAGFEKADIARFLNIRYQHARNVLLQAAEKSAAYDHQTRPADTSVLPEQEWLRVGPDGRVVIPPSDRHLLGVDGGGSILLLREGDSLRLMSRSAALKKAQDLVCRYVPEGVSLVDELLAERRAEAERDNGTAA